MATEPQAQDKNTPVEPETSKALTMDEFNAAFTAREKRLTSTLQKHFADTLAQALEPLKPKEAPAAAMKDQAAEDERIKKLHERVEAAEKSAQKEREAREAEAFKRMEDDERNTIDSMLRAAGVTDETRVRSARLLLKDAQRAYRNTDGNIVFKTKDKWESPVEVSLKEGLAEWIKSDEGKTFLPPRQVAGSGATPGAAQKGRQTNGRPTRLDIGHALAQGLGFGRREE